MRKALVIVAGMALLFGAVFFASSRIAGNSDTIARICESSNKQDAKQKALWEFIIKLPPSAAETPAQKAEREARTPGFVKYINETFAPQKCS